MAGRYERVNVADDDYLNDSAQQPHNSPPPSFHSRQSSRDRANRNNSNNNDDGVLFDAFGSEDDDSDDEVDDRQRLVRNNSFPANRPNPAADSDSIAPAIYQPRRPPAAPPAGASTSANANAQATSAANANSNSRIYGGGSQNEGVFANLMAKPETGGEEKDEMPPTYEQAAADAAPPYWETTILAPGLGGPDEVFIDGLPVGSVFSFVWNAMISMSFQLVGFLLTYLLHSSHAAKNGSLAGLGVTLIQFGFALHVSPDDGGGGGDPPPPMDGEGGYADPPNPNKHDFDPGEVTGDGGGIGDLTGSEWFSYVLMVAGWFMLIRAISEFLKARRHEQLVMQSPDRGLPVPIIATGESSERVV